MQRYVPTEDLNSLTQLPASFTPAKDAVRDFEKMKIGAFSSEELPYIEEILKSEILIALRSMGNAKDYKKEELNLLANQVLDGFLVRGNTMSFASMLLFFKMRRNKQAPLNNISFGVKPEAVLDDLNTFIDWQRKQVAEAMTKNPDKHLTLTQRSSALAGSLANAPYHIQKGFQDMKQRLKDLEKAKKAEKKSFADMRLQVARLIALLMYEYKNKEAAEKRCAELLKAWQPKTGLELKQYIDEDYPQQPKEQKQDLSLSVGYADEACTQMKVQVKGHNGAHKIDSDE
jgi:hypothetical protein